MAFRASSTFWKVTKAQPRWPLEYRSRMMEMSARAPYGPKMGMRSDSVIRLGTWPTKSLAVAAVVVLVVVLEEEDWVLAGLDVGDAVADGSAKAAASAAVAKEDLGALPCIATVVVDDSCISGIVVVTMP